jgi:hypothetical protein
VGQSLPLRGVDGSPEEVDRLTEAAGAFGDALRGPQACGPALEPPPDADGQTKLLAFLGRRAWT